MKYVLRLSVAALSVLSAVGAEPTPATGAGPPSMDEVEAMRERIAAIHRERALFSRLVATPVDDPFSAWKAYARQYAEASAEWILRWPGSELAWRERLRALALVEHPAPEKLDQAIESALTTKEWGVGFEEDVRWPIARLCLVHRWRLQEIEGWIESGLRADLERYPEWALAGLDAFEARRGRARLQAKAERLKADLAFRLGRAGALAKSNWGRPAPQQPPADPELVWDWAAARSDAVWKRARLARLRGRSSEALELYFEAWSERPRRVKRIRSMDPNGLLQEALELWVAMGGDERAGFERLAGKPGPRLPAATPILRWRRPGSAFSTSLAGHRWAAVWPSLDHRWGVALERIEAALPESLVVLADADREERLAAAMRAGGYTFDARAAAAEVRGLNRFRNLPRLLALDGDGGVIASASLENWSLKGLRGLLREGERLQLTDEGRSATTPSQSRNRSRPRTAGP